MPTSTYVPLATFTGSGTHAFTGIDQTYNHLIVVNYGRLSSAGVDNLFLQVGNGSYDTANNYTYQLFGTSNAGAYGGGSNLNISAMLVGAIDSDYFAVSTTIIMNYKSTSMQKNFICRNGGFNASGQSDAIWAGQWKATGTAINQLRFTQSFAAGSTTTIYGLVAQ